MPVRPQGIASGKRKCVIFEELQQGFEVHASADGVPRQAAAPARLLGRALGDLDAAARLDMRLLPFLSVGWSSEVTMSGSPLGSGCCVRL